MKYTHEKEINNTTNYLDLTITKNLQMKLIDSRIYHKPSIPQLSQQVKTSIPAQKISIFNSLIHRLITLPITKPNYKKELRFIEEMAVKNSFNLKTIHKLLRKHKSK